MSNYGYLHLNLKAIHVHLHPGRRRLGERVSGEPAGSGSDTGAAVFVWSPRCQVSVLGAGRVDGSC